MEPNGMVPFGTMKTNPFKYGCVVGGGWYCARPFLERFRAANRGAKPCGFSVPYNRPKSLVAVRGLPIGPCGGRSLGDLPDLRWIPARTAGSDWIGGYDEESRILQVMSGPDWMDFVRRMEHHFTRADKADINYAANSVYTPILQIIKSDMPEPMLELSSEIADVEMHYTFDGTLPDLHSPRYAKPLTIPRNASRLIVQSYRHGHKVGNLVKYELAIDPETKELRLR